MSAAVPDESPSPNCILLGRGTIPLPIELLQAHEEGRVIFFCGAGVSCRAELPLAHDLLQHINKSLNIKINKPQYIPTFTPTKKIQNSPTKKTVSASEPSVEEQYQRLERGASDRCCGNEKACKCVRCQVAKHLRPKPSAELGSHLAILKLSHPPHADPSGDGDGMAKNGFYRLVTTNFDLCFVEAEKRLPKSSRSFIAPLLPQPRPNSLEGVVYLHGRVRAVGSDDRDGGQTLVLTSADYGRAYITERWASRFVSELLRGFTVCFVGYSFDDTVMRYLRYAASTEVGEDGGFKQAYVFVPTNEAAAHDASAIKPIQFENFPRDYAKLHATLELWEKRSSQGRYGRPVIIDELAGSTPDTALPTDEGRLKWALGAKETAEALARSVSTADGDGAGTLPVSWIRVIASWHDGEQGFFAPRLPESARVKNATYPGLAKWFAAQAHFPEAIRWFCESRGPIDTRLREAIESADWFVKHRGGTQTGRDAAARFWHLALGGRSERDSLSVPASDEPTKSAELSFSGWSWDRRLEPRIHLQADMSHALHKRDHLADLKSWAVVLADSALADYFREALRVTGLGVERIPKFTFELADRLLALIDDAVALWSEIGTEPSQVSAWLDELDSDSPTLRDANEWLILPLLLDHMLQRAATAPAEAKRWIRSALPVKLPVKPSWVRDWLLLRAAAVPALVTNGDWINWVSQDGGRRARDPNLRRTLHRLGEQRWSGGLSAKLKKRLGGILPVVAEGVPPGLEVPVPHFESNEDAKIWLLDGPRGASGGEVLRTVSANAGFVVGAVCELTVPATRLTTDVLREVLEALSAVSVNAEDLSRIVEIIPRIRPEDAGSLAREAALVVSKAVREGVGVPAKLADALDFVSGFASDTDVPQADYLILAINQAAGIAAEARMRLWLRGATGTLNPVPKDLKQLVARRLQESGQLSAAVILGGYANHLYVADRPWAVDVLLAAMRSRERWTLAQALWIGYVRSGRLYAPVLEELAPVLLEAREWVSVDPEAARRFAQMCTLAAADGVCNLSDAEWGRLFSRFSDDQLVASAFQLARVLEAAGDRAPALWAKDGAVRRVLLLWPVERKIEDPRKAESIAMALTKPILEQPATLVDAVPLIESRLCPLPRYGVGIDEGLLSWVRGEQATKSSLEALKKLLGYISSKDPGDGPKGWQALLDAVRTRLTQI